MPARRLEAGGQGVAISVGPIRTEFTRIPQYRLARSPMLGEGDLIFAVGILAMSVFALQVDFLMQFMAVSAPTTEIQPSAQLIARLLAEDYSGDRHGHLDSDTGMTAEKKAPSFYLPVGNRGPLDHVGGATETAFHPVRAPHSEVVESTAAHQPLPRDAEQFAMEAPSPVPVIPGILEPQDLQGEDGIADSSEAAAVVPAELEEGWGFQDWMEVSEERIDPAFRAEIEKARLRLQINPDDSWALQQLGYYQYLADDHERCLVTYRRFLDLYPDSAAGHNNLALVYKRLGEYEIEEVFYLRALALEPGDTHAMNNLAVNLAHQERFDEALAIMDQLQELTPMDPYANLHRAKIYAAKGEEDEALYFLKLALQSVSRLDTLHHIEFRQDIRVDPAFDGLREQRQFTRLLSRYYGSDAEALLRGGASG
jgi:tetratricopeptide (TPR) repeat protein